VAALSAPRCGVTQKARRARQLYTQRDATHQLNLRSYTGTSTGPATVPAPAPAHGVNEPNGGLTTGWVRGGGQSTAEVYQAFRDDINMDVEQARQFGLIDSVLEKGQIVSVAGHAHIQPKTPPPPATESAVVKPAKTIGENVAEAKACNGRVAEAGAEVSSDEFTALYAAAMSGRVQAMQALLEAGAEVDHADSDGWTALHGASLLGHAEAVRALVGAGAEVERADNAGRTALYAAAMSGQVLAIQALVDAGADLNHADNTGLTPLAAARANNHEEAVLALVEAGATE
jgi:chloramphenicol 3-O-phosphotransferase